MSSPTEEALCTICHLVVYNDAPFITFPPEWDRKEEKAHLRCYLEKHNGVFYD